MAATATLGQRLRVMREMREMTQFDVARAIGTSQPAVSQWEADKHVPTLGFQKELARIYKVPRELIFGERVA